MRTMRTMRTMRRVRTDDKMVRKSPGQDRVWCSDRVTLPAPWCPSVSRPERPRD